MKNPSFKGLDDGHMFWMAQFASPTFDSLMFYYPGDGNWWLATYDVADSRLDWNKVSNTQCSPRHYFGKLTAGHRFWTGRFTQATRSEILFYYPGEGNWWRGMLALGELNWLKVSNTSSQPYDFGKLTNGHKLWTGRFSQDQLDEVLFYYPADGHWWLGTFQAPSSRFHWQKVSNTSASPSNFGKLTDGHKFWTGKFSQSALDEVLFYYPEDGHWWLAMHEPGSAKFHWRKISNTSASPNNFGKLTDGHKFWIGRFSQNQLDEVLFYYPGDGHWWLATFDPGQGQLHWRKVCNTHADPNNFGKLTDGHKFWIGEFEANKQRDEVLFYYPGDSRWWLGTPEAVTGNITWQRVRNKADFGDITDDEHRIWQGRLSQDKLDELLIYYDGDGHWWLGAFTLVAPLSGTIRWSNATLTAVKPPAGLFNIELDKINYVTTAPTASGPGLVLPQPEQVGTGYLTNKPYVDDGYTQVDFAVASVPTGVDLEFNIGIEAGGFSATNGADHFSVQRVAGPPKFKFVHASDNVSGLLYEVVGSSGSEVPR